MDVVRGDVSLSRAIRYQLIEHRQKGIHMMTNAQLAARLLREAAEIYRTLGAENSETQQQLNDFGVLYERVADMVEADPEGVVDGL